MGVVMVEVGCRLFLTHLVILVGGDVMHVDKLHTGLFHHFTVPTAIRVIAALDMAVFPDVARRQ